MKKKERKIRKYKTEERKNNKKSLLKKMATASIFDCGSSDVLDLPRRQLITYDDDLFAFGGDASSSSDHDEIDNVTKNLRISVTIDNTGDGNRKRKRFVDDDDDSDEAADDNYYHEPKKKRISNVPSCSSSSSSSIASAQQPNRTKTTKKETEPYTLLEAIGQGTYGQVWRGKCNETNTVVAIKRLKCKLNTPSTVCVNSFFSSHLI